MLRPFPESLMNPRKWLASLMSSVVAMEPMPMTCKINNGAQNKNINITSYYGISGNTHIMSNSITLLL